ncbi:MAG: hypothetical protein M1824_004072 [Vezdaea acicularis]|nr:MAG: hypothetical protein M1824_004072 [Vezdaea acicularis]
MLFTSTYLQSGTYLLGVCLFSIAFLVFLNASVSFVISDRLGVHHGIGDDVGTLGFADELVAIVMCPVWGILSDRIGVRTVCVVGYACVGLALFLFVQAKNVYPQLLMARLLFSVGGAATTTMVTAILPAMTAPSPPPDDQVNRPSLHTTSPSLSSELTVTPARLSNSTPPLSAAPSAKPPSAASPSRLAGLVGIFTGSGALLALGVFLPLPAWFSQRLNLSPSQAIADSYYVVGSIALLVSAACFLGLRHITGEAHKSLRHLLLPRRTDAPPHRPKPYATLFLSASRLAFTDLNIGLGYLGGAVARASSVGITLFIPLYIHAYFIRSGLCTGDPARGTEEMKHQCRRAYLLSAQLTGTSQLAALLFSPLVGWASDRFRRLNAPLLLGAALGVGAYSGFALLSSPEPTSARGGSPLVFVLAALIGLSQISAIVCSLGMIGRGVLSSKAGAANGQNPPPFADEEEAGTDAAAAAAATSPSQPNGAETTEVDPLLPPKPLDDPAAPENERDRAHLQGSIAGLYSLAGGAGILLLTKLGGWLFDRVAVAAPFWLLAGFNAVLLLVGCAVGGWVGVRGRMKRRVEE